MENCTNYSIEVFPVIPRTGRREWRWQTRGDSGSRIAIDDLAEARKKAKAVAEMFPGMPVRVVSQTIVDFFVS